MAEISIPTFDQLSVMMSHLLTNYTELVRVYWDMFYSTTPTTLTLKIYNEAGELIDVEVPNRALDFNFVRNGEGSPEGAVSAPIGTTYQDTLNGKLYIKQLGDGNTGWKLIGSDEGIRKGDSNPEGLITGAKGDLYEDRSSCSIYIKKTETGNTGWVLINAEVENLANRDLSNLAPAGQSILDSKENISNKIQVISGDSADKYPSEIAVKNYVTDVANTRAGINLDNLTDTGESHFANPDLSNLSYIGYEKINSKADRDLNNLSEEGEKRVSKLIPYAIESGNTDSHGNLDLLSVDTYFNTTYTFSSPGTYSITVPRDGDYEVEAVSGGGGGEHIDHYRHINAYHSYYSGSTGAYFKGKVHLTTGTHAIVVGAGGASYSTVSYPTISGSGGATSIGNVFTLSGGAGCGYEHVGVGGSLTNNSGVTEIETYNAGSNSIYYGINKDWYTSFGTQASPTPSELSGFGFGGSSGGPNIAATNGGNGYVKIVIADEGSTEVNYKVSGDSPLKIVGKDGLRKTIYGINNDQLTDLADGRYNKFVDETGSDFLKNNIYRTFNAPSTPATDDIWVKKTFPIEVYKYNGTTWEEYSRIFIGSVTIASGSVKSYTNAYLWDNGFNSTLYNRQVIKVGNVGGYWYRLYSDGWCEQGGLIAANLGTSGDITLPIPYKDDSWCPVVSCSSGTIAVGTNGSVTTMGWTKSNDAAVGFWVAYGFAAQSALNYMSQE